MRRLAGVAIGAGLVSASAVAAMLWNQTHVRQTVVNLTYTKPGSPQSYTAERLYGDPRSISEPVTDYPVRIATRCRIRQWTLTTNAGDTDVDNWATLSFPENSADNSALTCIAKFVKPFYVTLSWTSQ